MTFPFCGPQCPKDMSVCHQPFFIWIEMKIAERIKPSAKRQRRLTVCPFPDKGLVHLIPLWAAPHLKDPQGTQKTYEMGRAAQPTDKKPSLCPVPLTWTPVNTICLNNDQNTIDTMRLPRACPFSSAWLKEKRKIKRKKNHAKVAVICFTGLRFVQTEVWTGIPRSINPKE